MPRVLVVDDHSVFAEALTATLEAEPEIHCLGPAGSAEEALAILEQRCADVVLLDVNLPGMSGIEAVPHIHRMCRHARVVLLTAGVSGERLLEAIDSGAFGFLRKDTSLQEVVTTVLEMDERPTVDAHELRRLIEAGAGAGPTASGEDTGEPLTSRERDVLLLLADSVPVKQIAGKLDITIHTCRGHVRSLLRKLDAHSQLEAVLVAARAGMLPNLWASHDDWHA